MLEFKGKSFPCCTSLTMGVIGGKWKTVILYHLMEKPLRYSELRKSIGVVSERTLSLQLKQLEGDGVVLRKVYAEARPIKVEYSLTEFGKTLIPLLNMIADWGDMAMEHRVNKGTE